jgi:hypothetical protein
MNFAEAKRHTIERIRATSVQTEPFPYIYVENVFPGDFYAEMQRRLLDDGSYQRLADTGRVGKGYSRERFCFMPEQAAAGADAENADFWRQLFNTYCDDAFTALWVDVFADAIRDRIERQEVPQNLGDMPVAGEIFLMRDRETYELQPHTDSPAKVVSVLFYLPPDDSAAHLGTTLYVPKQPGRRDAGAAHLPRGDFDAAGTMPYRANTLFAFPKTAVSYHGVEPIAGPCRRDVMLFDIKFVQGPR